MLPSREFPSVPPESHAQRRTTMKRAHPSHRNSASPAHDTPLQEMHVFAGYFSNFQPASRMVHGSRKGKNLRTVPKCKQRRSASPLGKIVPCRGAKGNRGEGRNTTATISPKNDERRFIPRPSVKIRRGGENVPLVKRIAKLRASERRQNLGKCQTDFALPLPLPWRPLR